MVLPLLPMMVTVNVMTMMCSDDKKPGCSSRGYGVALIVFNILLEMATTPKDDRDNNEKLVVPRTQKQSGGSHGSKTAHEYALPWTQSPTA